MANHIKITGNELMEFLLKPYSFRKYSNFHGHFIIGTFFTMLEIWKSITKCLHVLIMRTRTFKHTSHTHIFRLLTNCKIRETNVMAYTFGRQLYIKLNLIIFVFRVNPNGFNFGIFSYQIRFECMYLSWIASYTHIKNS